MMNTQFLKFLTGAAVLSFLLLIARGAARAADADKPLLHAEGKVELKSPPDKAWDMVGDFTGLHHWHPGVKNVTLLEGKNRMPLAVRELDLGEGQWLISELLEWNGQERWMRYRILKSGLPIVNYVAVVAVAPTSSGGSLVTWKTEFRRREANGDDAGAVQLVQGVIDGGLNNLPKVLKE